MLIASGRFGVVVTLALAAALSVTACSAGSSTAPQRLPALTSSISQSPPPAATPHPTPPKTTAEATELAAARSVVMRYYQVLNGLHLHMNAAGFATIFTSDCPCQAQVRAIRSAKAKGEHYIDQVHIIKVTANVDGAGSADVLVVFNAARGGLVDRHNHQVTSAHAAQHVQRDFVLAKRGNVWRISQLVVA